jgi:glyoxylase-like metal-dependent hydrolase (beta-lactamase superfamily II)
MTVPDAIHDLPITVEGPDGDQTFHPAAVETAHGLLLLDVGLPGQADALESALENAGFSFADVDAILLTHQDGDHAGCLTEVVERVAAAAGTSPTVYAHVADAPYIDGRADPMKGSGDRYPPGEIDVELTDGVIFRTAAGPMRVVATPGHTPGHVSLYVPDEKFLIAADALRGADGLAGPPERFTPEMAEATASVGTLAELTVESVLCFHGGVVDAGTNEITQVHEELVAEYGDE